MTYKLVLIIIFVVIKINAIELGLPCKQFFKRYNSHYSTLIKDKIKPLKGFIEDKKEVVLHKIIRQRFSFNSNPPQNLKVKLASEKEMDSALRILHDSYVKKKYMEPNPEGVRITKYTYLPTTKTIVINKDSETIGTASVVMDTPQHGLPSEKLFNINDLRKEFGRGAEISSLAIDEKHRDGNTTNLLLMIKYIQTYCIKHLDLDYVVITVNPRYVKLYEAIFLFKQIGEISEKYDFVNGAPAAVLFLDLKTMKESYKKTYNHIKNPNKNLFQFVFNKDLDNLKFPDEVSTNKRKHISEERREDLGLRKLKPNYQAGP